jgi:glucuronate isomerase
MLMEHAQMSVDDGLVMQLHPGSARNYSSAIYKKYGPDRGFDIPIKAEFTNNLRPLLNHFGFEKNFKLALFTLDESTYSRELAPLAGAFPSIKLGPPWWFHDSLNGIRRWRDATVETAGYLNTIGFIDDTRAFLSIPVRHDVARRCEAGYLAELVLNHRVTEDDSHFLADQIAYYLSKDFFNL